MSDAASENADDTGVGTSLADSGGQEEELKRTIEEALACPCIDDIKAGPCGSSFVGAFSCFIRSQHAQQGKEVDCMDQFNAMQQCMGRHPEAFADVMQSMEGALNQSPQPQH